jgi:hypothetical protein
MAPRSSSSADSRRLRFKLGALIRAARIAHDLPNQTVAAERLGMGRFHLWELETSRIPPTDSERERLYQELPLLQLLVDHARRLESPHDVEVAPRL